MCVTYSLVNLSKDDFELGFPFRGVRDYEYEDFTDALSSLDYSGSSSSSLTIR
jgi:hypothetical protein